METRTKTTSYSTIRYPSLSPSTILTNNLPANQTFKQIDRHSDETNDEHKAEPTIGVQGKVKT